MKSNCLWYALDMWHAAGGALRFVKSTHWFMPHVQHVSKTGVLTQFVPPSDLKQPWHSVFGFEGVVEVGDKDADTRGTMHPLGTLVGAITLILLGGAWYAKRQYDYQRK